MPTLSASSGCQGRWDRRAAVVGYVLGKPFTSPEIVEITVRENENLVYIREAGHAGFDGLQSLADLRNNGNRLVHAAGLTDEERREAGEVFTRKVQGLAGTNV